MIDHLNLDRVVTRGARKVTIRGVEYDCSTVPAYVETAWYSILKLSVETTARTKELSEKMKAETDPAKIQEMINEATKREAEANQAVAETYDLALKVFELSGNPIDRQVLLDMDRDKFALLFKHMIFGSVAEKKSPVISP